jgi:hypothetical protein
MDREQPSLARDRLGMPPDAWMAELARAFSAGAVVVAGAGASA